MCDLIRDILPYYDFNGEVLDSYYYGYGNINKTLVINVRQSKKDKKYILQKINTNLFTNVDQLMSNIYKTTTHLKEKAKQRNDDISRLVLNIVPTKDGRLYLNVDDGCYRVYDYIDNSICLQKTSSKRIMRQVGLAFGQFQQDLSDFDASSLFEILPDFHNTKKRFEDFENIANIDSFNRVGEAKLLIKEFREKGKYASIIVDKQKDKKLPLRVTHNDTKLNNVVLDKKTKKALAVLDLDTVMPSTLCYDYGDAIRYGTSSAVEDEHNLDKVSVNLKLVEAFTKSYLQKTIKSLTTEELELLAISPLVIAYELGLRFLTDYLQGDTYFNTKYDKQNIYRAKVQLKLVNEFEKKYSSIKKIIYKYT